MFGLAFAMGSAPGGAAGGAGGGMAAFQQIIPLVFMFAIFYLLLIRPQQKKAKEHKALLEAMKRVIKKKDEMDEPNKRMARAKAKKKRKEKSKDY